MKKLFNLVALIMLLCFLSAITKAQILVANAGNDQTICMGMSVTLGGTPTASGGIPPYTYLWSNSSTAANPVVNPTASETYYLTVTDSTLNTATDTVNITISAPPIISVGPNATICFGNCVTLTASGGYSYIWSPNSGISSSTGANVVACPSMTTTYFVLAENAQGCTGTSNVTVTVDSSIEITLSSNPASCGLNNGSITTTISGGTAPFEYLWANGATTQIITNLSSGIYTVTVVDAAGCTNIDTVSVSSTSRLSVVLDTLINANCANGSLGSISVHGACGTGPYTYLWLFNGVLIDTSATIHNLAPGLYRVIVEDASTDTTSASFTISSISNMYASVNVTNSNCGYNGTATVYVHGAYPPFSYLWSDSLHQTTATATGLFQGTYWVTVTDSIGCTLIASAYIYSGCVNIIKGRIYYDLNQNCVQDSGEAGIPNLTVCAMPGYYYGYTDANGDFIINTPNMNNTLYAPTYWPMPYAITCPSAGTYTVNFTGGGDTASGNNFGYYADSNYFDVGIHPGWTSADPGFTKRFWIYYYNNSPSPQNVLIRFTYDTLLQFDSCTDGGINYPTQHKIEWTINGVPPGAYSYPYWYFISGIYFYVPTTVTLSTILDYCFEIFPIAGDANPSDNTLCAEETVIGCHDPNSKTVSPIGAGSQKLITQSDTTLMYTIHFQNTGTDTAFTVIVVDTLSPYLDPSSIVPGASNYPYTFTLSGQGVLTFRFDHILLPDSNENKTASSGYLNYTVKQKANNPDGAVINNTAAIYFDFNAPINTNTAFNTLDYDLFIQEKLPGHNGLKISPNPFHDAFTLEITGKASYPCNVKITNSIGDVIMTEEVAQPVVSLNIPGLADGMYFIAVDDNNGKTIAKGKLISQ